MANTNSVLLVEDSQSTQLIVKAAIQSICKLAIAPTGKDCMTHIQSEHFDLILLDVDLPDSNGFDLYNFIRQDKRFAHTPIMFLTGKGETEDRVRGFSLGAEDYLVKPIDPLVFKARIESKLKNLKAQDQASNHFYLGPFSVDIASQTIHVQLPGKEDLERLSLTSNQFKILFYLLKHEDETVTRSELLNEAWGKGVHVTNRTIDTHVYSIRQKLGELSSVLQSVHGEGYKLSLRRFNSQRAS